MRVKLGYRDKLVYIENGWVYLFDKKLHCAPLEEVLQSKYSKDALIPPQLRKIASDVVELLEAPAFLDRSEKRTTHGLPRQGIYA